jgi:hypothetical protein
MRLVFRAAFFLAAMLAITSLIPSAGFAQTEAVPSPGLANGPCADDVNRFCADVKGKRGEVPACLRAKSSELTAECRQEVEDRDARIAQRVAIAESECSAELTKFCAGKPDYEKVKCLRGHFDELSEGCQLVVPEPRTE